MAKSKTQYVCSACGATHSKWAGKCDACGAWDTLSEEVMQVTPKGMSAGKGAIIQFTGLQDEVEHEPRFRTTLNEFDRVLGGGIVPGSATLIGGDPGIGKSTLLLQAVAALADEGHKTVYISGEESVAQVQLRAQRLGVKGDGESAGTKAKHKGEAVQLAHAASVRDILTSLKIIQPAVVVIDSVQTMFVDSVDAAPGTVSQLRASTHELINFAKSHNVALLLVGHVTKDGQIAGPRVLEHMVDTVLYFEGDRGHAFRILRGVKNRFGATDEIGVFSMEGEGLMGVENPSALFLAERSNPVSGAVVFAGVEGSRPLLVEIEALVAPSHLATPRRAVVGWDSNRLAMILAVLETRAGLKFSDQEVYLNVAGGLRVSEPAADLAVAAALISSRMNRPVKQDSVWFGEIGLSGEIRRTAKADQRFKEASKLGFSHVYCPAQGKKKAAKNGNQSNKGDNPLGISALHHVEDIVASIGNG